MVFSKPKLIVSPLNIEEEKPKESEMYLRLAEIEVSQISLLKIKTLIRLEEREVVTHLK